MPKQVFACSDATLADLNVSSLVYAISAHLLSAALGPGTVSSSSVDTEPLGLAEPWEPGNPGYPGLDQNFVDSVLCQSLVL